MLKAEIDHIQEKHLDILYRILKAFEAQAGMRAADVDWPSFVEETYGSLSDAPISRDTQGTYEKRESMR